MTFLGRFFRHDYRPASKSGPWLCKPHIVYSRCCPSFLFTPICHPWSANGHCTRLTCMLKTFYNLPRTVPKKKKNQANQHSQCDSNQNENSGTGWPHKNYNLWVVFQSQSTGNFLINLWATPYSENQRFTIPKLGLSALEKKKKKRKERCLNMDTLHSVSEDCESLLVIFYVYGARCLFSRSSVPCQKP